MVNLDNLQYTDLLDELVKQALLTAKTDKMLAEKPKTREEAKELSSAMLKLFDCNDAISIYESILLHTTNYITPLDTDVCFLSPVAVIQFEYDYGNHNDNRKAVSIADADSYTAERLKQALINASFSNLTAYLPYKLRNTKLQFILPEILVIDKKFYLKTIVRFIDNCPTEHQKQQMLEYLSGQFSDGFGECFEQTPFMTIAATDIYAILWWSDESSFKESISKWSIKEIKGYSK